MLFARDTLTMSELYGPTYSLIPMDPDTRRGLFAVGFMAALSVVCTSSLLMWITYRLIFWKKYYRSYVGYNQNIILIYQLLLADLQQSVGFVLSFHWIAQNKIVGPSGACFAQGWFIEIGDVASGFFVLSIALHTYISVVYGRRIPYKYFVAYIIGVWAAALILTALGPITLGRYVFLRAGSWCWIPANHETSRLTLHYIWIFVDEFGTIITYALVFWHLRKQVTSVVQSDVVSKATRCMVFYPMAYVVLTLPLATGRMAAMGGHTFPNPYYLAAGSMITSCGWVDCLLYTLTRRVLVSSEVSHTTDPHTRSTGYPVKRHKMEFEQMSDGKGSTDSIINNSMRLGDIKAETKVEVTISDVNASERREDNYYRSECVPNGTFPGASRTSRV